MSKKQLSGLKSVGAILAGYFALALPLGFMFFVASKLVPPDALTRTPFLAFNVVCDILAGVFGGWVVARLAPRTPMTHAALLAALLMAGAVGDTMANRESGRPLWIGVLRVIVMPAAVLSGSKIMKRRWTSGPATS